MCFERFCLEIVITQVITRRRIAFGALGLEHIRMQDGLQCLRTPCETKHYDVRHYQSIVAAWLFKPALAQ